MKRDPQIHIRIPEPLKDLIHEEARLNNRSVNSEIVGMLSEMVRLRSPQRDLLMPVKQVEILMKGDMFEDIISSTLRNCAASINASIAEGLRHAEVRHYFSSQADAAQYFSSVKLKLEELGYTADFDDVNILIKY